MKEIFKRHPKFDVAPEDFASLPENLWVRCSRCHELLYSREHEQALWVCSKCKYHFAISVYQRVGITVDPGSFQECDSGMRSRDPLAFRSSSETYAEKLRQYAERAKTNEAFIYGTGRVERQDMVIGATEFQFCGGSMGPVFGEKVARSVELALDRRVPLVIVSNSGGARMQEGTISLFQMAKTVVSLERFKDAGLPFISIMTDPCLGGTTASYAMLGDVNIAEPGAYIGFAGRRVIEQTMRQKLPHDAATSEFLLQHGMIDMVLSRSEIPAVLGRLLRMYTAVASSSPNEVLVGELA
ncbi:MAG: acetyl-CoA carboxylase, carboxyltransferase subunit beta [Chloroflexota bacterium]|nr:MAG: acetyl-CoA carboxylase, carboxyltransferase subunit beta [Chloroflexota bacterium]